MKPSNKLYCIMFPDTAENIEQRLVINSACRSAEEAAMYVDDRRANADGFPGEYVAAIPAAQYDAMNANHGRGAW